MSSRSWKTHIYRTIAKEISRSSRYFERLYQWPAQKSDPGLLFDAIECTKKTRLESSEALPDCSSKRSLILLNGTFNHHLNIQSLLTDIKKKCARTTRLIVVAYNPYFRVFYQLASKFRLRSREEEISTFLTKVDLQNICLLSGFEVVRSRPAAYFPFSLLGLGTLIDSLLAAIPFFRWLGFVHVFTLRPVVPLEHAPSLSIIVPARNEKGNIENALKRIPKLPTDDIEVVFVEGHSTDQTWEEIQRVLPLYRNRFKLQAHKQPGKGKNDAVRKGFAHASGDLLTILDADLTTPPELLGDFYEAYREGHADFINGNRLVYPMEGQAMRFLNHLGNVFFAKALSFVLDVRLGDSLCGTKLFSRADYERFLAWRKSFGDFDPFGDYELLFPASVLGLGIIDIPLRYRDRTYGSTNISRFRHGAILLKMTWVGFWKIRVGEWRSQKRIPQESLSEPLSELRDQAPSNTN